MHGLFSVCAVPRYGFGGCAEEGLEQRKKALAGLGEQRRRDDGGTCKVSPGPTC